MAGVQATVTLTPCPLGIDTSDNTNAPYYVYVSGAPGVAEAVAVTGGSACSAGSQTLVFTPANSHNSGYTVQSASSGIQEAVNDAGTPDAYLILPPVGNSNPYNIYATVFLHSNKMTLEGYGALVQCYTRAVCVQAGDRASDYQYIKILGIRFAAGIQVDGSQIVSVARASSGVVTVTTAANHGFVTGDTAFVWYYSANLTFHGIAQITGVTSNTFTYASTAGTIASTSAFGWTALEDAAIEDGADGTMIRDVNLTSNGYPNLFHFGIVVDNDQKATIDDTQNEASSHVLRCDANFCGAYVLGRGDNSNAGVIYLTHSELSLQCGGNGVLDFSGNSLHVSDTVVEGFAQYGIFYEAGLQPAMLTNLYEDVGGCANPIYPGSVVADAGVIARNQPLTVNGSSPLIGSIPVFANTGTTYRNYYVAAQSTGYGTGPVLPIGYALTSGSGTISIYWPQIPADNSAGTITYDVLVTTGQNTAAPYFGGTATSIATGLGGSCSNGICTFSDTQSTGSSYSYAGQTWLPNLWFWPGSVILSDNTNYSGSHGSATELFADESPTPIVSSAGTIRVSAFVHLCAASYPTTPVWIECLGTQPTAGSGNYATDLQQTDPAGNISMNIKGRLNFGRLGRPPLHIITLVDSNPWKTLATVGGRPSNDVNDVYIGLDGTSGQGVNLAQMSLGAPNAINQYLSNIGDGTSWMISLSKILYGSTNGGLQIKVPFGTGSSGNTDNAGSGTLTAGSFTYTFTGTYTSSPICIATDTSSAAPVQVTATTTTLTIAGTAGHGVNYICIGRN